MAFNCPYAEKRKNQNFLICKFLQKKKKLNYDVLSNASQVVCAYQRYCNCEKGIINSEGAEQCYQRHNSKKK